MNNELQKTLETARQRRQLLALYRDELPDCADHTGIPVLVGPSLVLLHRELDFGLDGYVALRAADISCTEQVDACGFIAAILRGEKTYDKVAVPKLCGVESWQGLLGGVQAGFGGWLTVETVADDGCCFFLGVISRLDQNYLYLRQVEADGQRHQEETTVPLQDIVTVAFGSRYLELYKKYCR